MTDRGNWCCPTRPSARDPLPEPDRWGHRGCSSSDNCRRHPANCTWGPGRLPSVRSEVPAGPGLVRDNASVWLEESRSPTATPRSHPVVPHRRSANRMTATRSDPGEASRSSRSSRPAAKQSSRCAACTYSCCARCGTGVPRCDASCGRSRIDRDAARAGAGARRNEPPAPGSP